MTDYFRQVRTLLGSDRRMLVGLFALYGVSSLLEVVSLGLVAPYIAFVLQPGATGTITEMARKYLGQAPSVQTVAVWGGVALSAIFLVKSLFVIYVNASAIRFCMRQLRVLRSRLIARFFSRPYLEHVGSNSSRILNSVQHLTYNYAINFLLPTIRMAGDIVVGFTILVVLAAVDWRALATLLGLIAALIVGYDRAFGRAIIGYGARANESQRAAIQSVNEAAGGFKEIKVLGKEAFFVDRVMQATDEYCLNQGRSQLLSVVPRYLIEVVLIVFFVLVTIYATLQYGSAATAIPALSVFGLASIRLLPVANSVAYGIAQIRYGRDVVATLHADLQARETESSPSVAEAQPSPHAHTPFRELRLNDVSFRYPGADADVLHGVDIEVHAGEIVGIVGPSGAGKTTLVDILLGFLRPRTGTVEFNGADIHRDLAGWRSAVAYIPQENFILDDSIRSNIVIDPAGGHNASKIDSVLSQASLDEFVRSLPEGLDTNLGEHGSRLSGGQRQRVSLARALFHDRSVIVLDEATSALDQKTENEIIAMINQLKGRRTIILISHRPSTLGTCDRIYRLSAGRVQAQPRLEEAA